MEGLNRGGAARSLELYAPFPLITGPQETQMGALYKLMTAWDNLAASLVAEMVKNPLQCRRPRFDPWAGKIPWRRTW